MRFSPAIACRSFRPAEPHEHSIQLRRARRTENHFVVVILRSHSVCESGSVAAGAVMVDHPRAIDDVVKLVPIEQSREIGGPDPGAVQRLVLDAPLPAHCKGQAIGRWLKRLEYRSELHLPCLHIVKRRQRPVRDQPLRSPTSVVEHVVEHDAAVDLYVSTVWYVRSVLVYGLHDFDIEPPARTCACIRRSRHRKRHSVANLAHVGLTLRRKDHFVIVLRLKEAPRIREHYTYQVAASAVPIHHSQLQCVEHIAVPIHPQYPRNFPQRNVSGAHGTGPIISVGRSPCASHRRPEIRALIAKVLDVRLTTPEHARGTTEKKLKAPTAWSVSRPASPFANPTCRHVLHRRHAIDLHRRGAVGSLHPNGCPRVDTKRRNVGSRNDARHAVPSRSEQHVTAQRDRGFVVVRRIAEVEHDAHARIGVRSTNGR